MSDARKQTTTRVVGNYLDSRYIPRLYYLTVVEVRLPTGIRTEAPESVEPQPMLEDPRATPQTPPFAPAWPTL